MKYLGKRSLSALLVLAMLLSLLPRLPLKAKAGGIIPGQLATVDAGQELTLEVQGGYDSRLTTNLVFETVGNTIATIVGYDRSGEKIMDKAVCDDDYLDILYNRTMGDRFEIKVVYGQIKVSFNLANHNEDPICTYYEFGDKLDWLVKPTVSEVWLTVGDTAVLNVSEVTDGFSARANDYEDNYNDVARVDETGIITAEAPGTATVYMQVLFWQTSTEYFYFWVPCTVHVVEDYTLGAYRDFYYAEPDQAYFNIVAYRSDGMRDTGFDVTVGDQTYNTGSRTNVLVDMPADFDGSVTISKEGYVPYVLTNDHLEVNNVITMTPDQGEDPVIQAVWIRKETDSEYVNAKYQTIQVIEGKATQYSISYDAFWNGHSCSSVFLQQGTVTLPLSDQGDTVALGQYLKADGGQVYLHALTNDGYVVSVPLLLNVAAEVTFMEMSFGENVSTSVDESVTGLGGQTVGFDLLSNVPVKFELGADGSVRGLIGLKFSGPSSGETDLWEIQDEIREIVKEVEDAKESGDKKLTGSLKEKLNETLEDEKAYLENRKVGFGFSTDASFLGYFDGVMTDEGMDITEVGMIAIFNVSATGSQNFRIGQVPAEWKLSFADELELLVCGLAEGSNGKLNFRVPEFTNKISVTGGVRAHALDLVGASISIQGNFTFDYPSEADSFADGTWSVDANFTVTGDIADTDFELLKLDSIDGLKIWPDTELTANAVADMRMSAAPGLDIDIEEGVENAYEASVAFRPDIGTDSVPQLMRLADMDVLVWTEDMDSRAAEADRPCLYYAVRSHETDTWSEPVPVYDNGTPDYAPRLMMAGDTLYVTWQKPVGSLAGLTETADILASRDIYVARFDTASATFQTAEMVHDPDDTLDMLPQVQVWNDSLAVAWVRVSGDLTDSETTGSILRSTYSEEDGWTTRSVADVPGIPDGLAFGEDGTLYYTLNGRLYSLADGVTTAMTPEDAYARAPKFCQGTLYWLEDSCVTDGTVRIPADGTTGDFSLHISPDGSRKVLTFYAADENGRQLFATYGQDDSWGQPVSVMMDASDAWHSGLNGYYDNNGQLCVAVNRLRTFSSGNQVSYLRLITETPRQDLVITGLDHLGTSMTESGYLLTDVFVTNAGTLPVNTVQLQVIEGETPLMNKAVQLELMPGQSGSAELLIPMDIAVREGITVTAQPVDGTDEDLTNNTADLVLNLGDISAEYMTLDTLPDGTVHVAAMLINRGMTDLENIEVVFTRGTPDGEVLGTLEAGGAALGQVIPVDTTLSGLTEGELVYMTALLEVEENYISNNTAFARVCPVLRETSVAKSSEDLENQQLELDTDYNFFAVRDEETDRVSEFAGIFTPEETGFYLVYLNGRNSWNYYNMYCRAETVDGAYADQEWVREIYTDLSRGWEAQRILSVYMEAGTSYSINVTASGGTVAVVRMERAPGVTGLQTRDHTMYLAEDLLWNHGDIHDLGLVTFLPELSRDILSFSSSNESVATVDEYGDITTSGVGTAVITARGQVYGVEGSFTITVVEPEYGDPLVLGSNTVTVGEEEEQIVRVFTAPETGYYQFAMDEENTFYVLIDGEFEYISGSGAVLLRAGEEYPCYFQWSDTLTVRKVDVRGDIGLEDYQECDGSDCQNVMVYRYAPEEDHILHVWFAGESCSLKIYDDSYDLLYSASRSSGWYGSKTLDAVMEGGKTYYIALEHEDEAALELIKVTMELNYYGAVFVGDTVELSPGFPNGGDEEAYTYTWSSSDPSVAQVDQNGVVQFLKEGDVTITVTAEDGMLRAEKSFYAIKPQQITLNQEYSTTLDNQRIKAVRLIFTPETSGDYVYTIRYQNPGDGYWMYEYSLTDEDGDYLELIHTEDVRGQGNNSSIHLEAGQTCVLTLYYEADGNSISSIDLTFKVTGMDCDTKGHTYGPGYSWEPGCDYPGMTAGEHCQICGHVRVPQEEIPALGHDFVDGECTRCGESEFEQPPREVEVIRLSGKGRCETAILIAEELKETLEVEKFNTIIIANGNNFADALAGSYLAAAKDAPILLSWGSNDKHAANIQYIKDNLVSGGTVYILGGTAAVPGLYEEGLEGIHVERLSGKSRFDTNIEILEEAGIEAGSEVLVSTGWNYADSLSASATGKPILLLNTNTGKLEESQTAFLSELEEKNCTFTIIGGTGAVSAELAADLEAYGNVDRISGKTRYETSVKVAEAYFVSPESAVLAYGRNFPDGLCGGALAFSMNAPLILTQTGAEAAAADYIQGQGIKSGVVLGGTGALSDEVVRAVFAMEAEDEIIVKK